MRRIVVLAVIWGWSFLFIKVAVEGMTPTTVAAARIVLGALVMVAMLALRREALPRDPQLWRHFAVMGFTYSALPFSLLAWGEQYITSALAAVLNASTPLFAALLTVVVLEERLTRLQSVGLVLGFVGVAVAAGVGTGDIAASSIGGILAVIGTSASYGVAFVYARRHLGGVAPITATCGQLLAATVLVLPFAVVTTLRQGIHLAPHRILAVAILGVVGTGIAYVINYRSIADVGATRASVVTQLVPVVAVTVGVLFLHEPFRLKLVAGGALTILGIALLHDRVRFGARARAAAPEAP
ncbi:MAG TPA: DMT family transporter [Acidimicrobiales bacterium]|nr:DMT family transporter [Acidimicrobiales bacterium]